jgi:tRNA U38,U39,U40 pseudouridine synthase TruA
MEVHQLLYSQVISKIPTATSQIVKDSVICHIIRKVQKEFDAQTAVTERTYYVLKASVILK